MAFDGTGTFVRNNGGNSGSTTWALDAAAGTKITTARHDTHDQDIANGLTNCVTKDGQTTPTANLPMGGFGHTNAAAATARTMYARASQVQDSALLYGGLTTGAANVFVATLSPAITAYVTGMRIVVLTHQANTGACTLNVNSVGAVAIKVLAADPTSGSIPTGQMATFIYDGTYFQLQNVSGLVTSIATDKLLGRDTAGTGLVEQIGLGASLAFDGSGNIQRAALTGDVTAAANGNATTIAANAVTTAKILDANVTSAKLDADAASRSAPIATFWSSALATGSGSGVMPVAGSSTSGIIIVIPKACKITHLSGNIASGVTSGTSTFTLTKNGVTTSQTLVFTSADNNGGTGNAHDYVAITAQSYAAGDFVQITYSNSALVLASSPAQVLITAWGHYTA